MNLKKYVHFMSVWLLLTALFSLTLMNTGFTTSLAVTVGGTPATPTNSIPVPAHTNGVGNGKGVVLMYHHLVDNDLYNTGKFKNNNAVMPVKQFEEHMKYLADNGYKALFMSELSDYLKKGVALPAKTVVITFDDGYESNSVYAVPILEKYKLKATIAVVVKDSVDVSAQASKPFDSSVLTHLTFDQMRAMQKTGLIEFGSHSYDGHKYILTDSGQQDKFFTKKLYLESLGRNENANEYLQRIEDDLRRSKSILERELGTRVTYFAYPYGAYNNSVKRAVENIGFEIAVTVKSGVIDKSSTALTLNRKNVKPNLTLVEFATLVKTT